MATETAELVKSPVSDRLVTPAVAKCQRMERAICRRLILDAIKAGYSVGVYDGEEHVLRYATTAKACLEKMFTVDEERLIFYKDQLQVGTAWLVYGNDGYDVICDYTVRMEHIMAGAHRMSDRLADQRW